MKRILACLAALALTATASGVRADSPATPATMDPVGDLISQVIQKAGPVFDFFRLKATLYHAGARGVGNRDSLGCQVVAMRTAAVDGVSVPRRTVLFIKETVGLPMPDGRVHDGYWYASDVGGAIHKGRIDLYTGAGPGSMRPMMPLNLSLLTVAKVGQFKGCPLALGPSGPEARS
jgi:3D (Asp-Asp-Asp) domain-containing protein